MLCKIHNRQLEAPTKWKIFSCLHPQLQGFRKLTNNANSLRSIAWCHSWNSHPAPRRSIILHQDTGGARRWAGMLQTPSVSPSNQENELQNNQNHDLGVAFGLASARWRPILLLTGNAAVPRCVSQLGQLGFSWVGSGSAPAALAQSPTLVF